MKTPAKISLALGVIFLALIVLAAAPPPGTYIVPSFFTTNAAKIIGTNGVGVSSNTVNGTYFIDGSALTGVTNIFNQNQFTQVGVGGTNVNIKNGAWATNLNTFVLTNEGGANFHGEITNWGNTWWGPSLGGVFPPDVYRIQQDGGFLLGSGYLDGFIGDASFGRNWIIGSDGAGYLGGGHFRFYDNGHITNISITTIIITNLSLTANKLVLSSPSKSLISSSFTDTDFALKTALSNSYTFDSTQFARTGAGGTNIAIKSGALLTNVLTIASNNVLLTASPTQVDFYGFTLMTNSNNKISIGAPTGTGSGATNIFNPNQFTQIGVGGTNVNIKDGVLLTNLLDYGTATFDGTLQDSAANKWNIQANGAANFGGLVSGFDNSGGLFVGVGPLFQVTAVDGNLGTIKGLGGYLWPSAHALGALTNDAGGNLGWFPGYITASSLDGYGFIFGATNYGSTIGRGSNFVMAVQTNLLMAATNQTAAGGTNFVKLDTAQPITTTAQPTFAGLTDTGNLAVQGTSTNTGAINNAAGVTNWATTRHVGAVENQSTVTNSSWQNTAGGVTNYSTTRHVGAVEHQSTTTNTSWINNGGVITNYPPSTTTIPQWTALAGGHNADAFAILQGPSKVGGFDSNGLAWFYPSNATVVYPACYRIFTQTADGSCTNITTVETSWFGTGVGSLTLPAGFWQVGRSVKIEMKGQHWTGTPLANLIKLKLGTTAVATNLPNSLISSLVAEMFEADFILTCRTNSATVGYIQAQGRFNFPTAAGGGIYGFRFMKSTLPIFDTTAAMAIDVTSTNGNSATSFMIKDAIVTVIP